MLFCRCQITKPHQDSFLFFILLEGHGSKRHRFPITPLHVQDNVASWFYAHNYFPMSLTTHHKRCEYITREPQFFHEDYDEFMFWSPLILSGTIFSTVTWRLYPVIRTGRVDGQDAPLSISTFEANVKVRQRSKQSFCFSNILLQKKKKKE